MKKETITILIDNEENLLKIRERFKQSSLSEKYKLNIIICGREEPKKSLSEFLLSKLN